MWKKMVRIEIYFKAGAFRFPVFTQTRLELQSFLERNAFAYRGKPIGVKLEARPDLIPLNRAAGRACSWLTAQGVCTTRNDPNQVVRPHWGAQTLLLRHTMTSDLLATYSADAGWRIEEDAWSKHLPNINVDVAYRHLS